LYTSCWIRCCRMLIAGFSSVDCLSVVRNEYWEVYRPSTNFGCCLRAKLVLLVWLSLEVLGYAWITEIYSRREAWFGTRLQPGSTIGNTTKWLDPVKSVVSRRQNFLLSGAWFDHLKQLRDRGRF
jgi:hypothetical protein